MEIKKYRLKETEVHVEAVYLDRRDTDPYEVAKWCNGEVVIPEGMNYTGGPLVVKFVSGFSSGYDAVGVDNYLVKAPGGEFFSRSKGVFEEQYSEASEEPDAEPEDSHTRLPSGVWSNLFGVTILDPDGWDRKNFAQSWAEYITEEEFIRRAGPSTMGMKHGLIEPPVLTYFWDVLPHA